MPEAGQANFGKQPRGDLRRERDEALAEIARLRALVLSGERDLDRVSNEIERLRAALTEVLEIADDEAQYMPESLLHKFGYPEDLARLRAVLGGT